jgi:hypothetical protein
VLPLLTKYLIQYRRVSIPHIGTFELVQQTATLNIGEKLITAPHFSAKYQNLDAIPEHQFNYIVNHDPTGKEKINELFSFGEELKTRIREQPFQWNGFGTLSFTANELVFEPKLIELDSLQEIRAEKVLRQNASHNMLVGDQEISSGQTGKSLGKMIYRKPFMLIGWILLALAATAIIYILFRNNFQPSSAGMQINWPY